VAQSHLLNSRRLQFFIYFLLRNILYQRHTLKYIFFFPNLTSLKYSKIKRKLLLLFQEFPKNRGGLCKAKTARGLSGGQTAEVQWHPWVPELSASLLRHRERP